MIDCELIIYKYLITKFINMKTTNLTLIHLKLFKTYSFVIANYFFLLHSYLKLYQILISMKNYKILNNNEISEILKH